MSTDLTLTHSQYTDNQRNWKLVRDIIKGEYALKCHDLNNFKDTSLTNGMSLKHNGIPFTPTAISSGLDLIYLPFTSQVMDTENIKRYITYVQRASLFNATQRTLNGMMGMVHTKQSVIDMPPSLDYVTTNIDGAGIGIVDQSIRVLEDVLVTGRSGLFVDYPLVDRTLSVAEQREQNIRALIVKYSPEQILDWDTEVINGVKTINFVKLIEYVSKRDPNNIFVSEMVEQIRVLILTDDGYIQQLYDGSGELISETQPLDYSGQPLYFIPFFFIGAVDNSETPDTAPLLDLAELNIKHYRNSADYEESVFLVGQPMYGISGLSDQWIKDHFPNGITVGSRQGLMLPESGAINIAQANPNTMALEGMKQKELQMKMLGARLISEGGVAETATAARIRHSADASVLKIVVRNITTAYLDALIVVQLFNGVFEEYRFELNDSFFASDLTGAEVVQLVSAWLQGGISREALDDKLVDGGFVVDSE